MSEQFREILCDLGYTLRDYGREWRTRPIYRNSNNNSSLRIFKDTGRFQDFSAGLSGTFENLVKISLGLKSIEEAKKYLQERNYFNEHKESKPSIDMIKIFDKSLLDKLLPEHSYWLKRGVSLETLTLFKGGLATGGKMYHRYVFPIFNDINQIVGFSGRAILESDLKWKHLGRKGSWAYPLFLNRSIIQKNRSIILVESIGDLLALWDADIKNVLVFFGINKTGGLSSGLRDAIIGLDPEIIYVACNDDTNNNMIGNNAAKEIRKRLVKYFSEEQVKITLPTKKDFGEMSKEEILQWKNKYQIK